MTKSRGTSVATNGATHPPWLPPTTPTRRIPGASRRVSLTAAAVSRARAWKSEDRFPVDAPVQRLS